VLEKLRKELPKVPIGEVVFDFNDNGSGSDKTINLSLVGDSGQSAARCFHYGDRDPAPGAGAARRQREPG
jgi:hypothetical protein